MPGLFVTLVLAAQTASAGSVECDILEASLSTTTVSDELSRGSEVSVWGAPDWPAQLSESDPVWDCTLSGNMRWERQTPEGFVGSERSLSIRAEWPLIAGDTATLTLHYTHWAPSENIGWVSEEVLLLTREETDWSIAASRRDLIAD